MQINTILNCSIALSYGPSLALSNIVFFKETVKQFFLRNRTCTVKLFNRGNLFSKEAHHLKSDTQGFRAQFSILPASGLWENNSATLCSALSSIKQLKDYLPYRVTVSKKGKTIT